MSATRPTTNELCDYAREVIRIEAEAVAALADRIDTTFARAVEAMLECPGRIIVTGMGKSGLVGRKLVATLNSTGVSSFFLHPAEAVHGDMGILRADDIVLMISKSGRIDELEPILALARRLGSRILALCGCRDSELFRRADLALDCTVEREACPNNLAPTCSSTAALVLGDALALALLRARNFTSADFAQLHPGGALGRRLLKRVDECHHGGSDIPLVAADATVSEMVLEMTSKRLGCVLLTDADGRPSGIFTDGDLRRLVQEKSDVYGLAASAVVHRDPKTIPADSVLDAALALMEKHSITQLATVDRDGRLVGVIHLHDILKSKLV